MKSLKLLNLLQSHTTINPLQNAPPALNIFIPSFFPPPEAILNSRSRISYRFQSRGPSSGKAGSQKQSGGPLSTFYTESGIIQLLAFPQNQHDHGR